MNGIRTNGIIPTYITNLYIDDIFLTSKPSSGYLRTVFFSPVNHSSKYFTSFLLNVFFVCHGLNERNEDNKKLLHTSEK